MQNTDTEYPIEKCFEHHVYDIKYEILPLYRPLKPSSFRICNKDNIPYFEDFI